MITGFRNEPTQDVDAMWEADAAAEWERINETTDDEHKFIEASYHLDKAWDMISEGFTALADAAGEAEGTVAEDRIVSIMNAIEDLSEEIRIMKEKMRKGRFE